MSVSRASNQAPDPSPAPTPNQAASSHGSPPSRWEADGPFDQLRDLMDRAAKGEIDLDAGHAVAGDGKLPSAWYAPPPELPPAPFLHRTRLRPEVLAGLLGLGAGLALLLPLAFWWQQTSSVVTSAAPVSTSLTADAGQSGQERIDLVPVKAVSLVKPNEDETIAEAKAMLAEGDVLAVRALLAKAVAARDPEGLFLMAETYDPNILASLRARGVGADTDRARALYRAAHGLGHPRAAARLAGLQ